MPNTGIDGDFMEALGKDRSIVHRTQVAGGLKPRSIEKGRTGFRHMAARQFIYRDFVVSEL